jgi:cytochrome P450
MLDKASVMLTAAGTVPGAAAAAASGATLSPPALPTTTTLALLTTLALAAALSLPTLIRELDAWRRWRRLPGPPAPTYLLAHAPVLTSPRAPMILHQYAERYGDLVRIRLAHRRAVVVGDPRAYASLTRRNAQPRLPKDGGMYAALNIGIEGRPNSILTEAEDTPVWSAVRKALAPAFSVASLRARVFPPLRDSLEQVAAHLRNEHARLVVQGRQPAEAAEVDVESLAKRITADVIFVLLLGKPLGGTASFCSAPLPEAGASGTEAAKLRERALADAAADRLLGLLGNAAPAAPAPAAPAAPPAACEKEKEKEEEEEEEAEALLDAEEYVAMVEALLEAAARVMSNPLRAPFQPLLRLLGDAHAQRDAKIERAFGLMMRARVEQLDRQPPPDGTVARALLAVVDPSTGQRLPADRRASELSIILNAGFETTSRSIVCTLAALAEHPEAQERVADELRRAGLVGGGGRRLLEYSDLSPSALPYLHAVTKESLRMYPPAALGTGRVVPSAAAAASATANAPICGLDVPPGTIVMLPAYVSGRRTSAYGADASEFKPERWLVGKEGGGGGEGEAGGGGGESGGGVDDGGGGTAFSPLPEAPTFSFGPRDCVGQSLARVELVAAVAALVAAFKWRPAERVTAAGGLEALLHFTITLGTEAGMPLVFEPRE